MQTESLVERLAGQLRPVRRRSPLRDGALLVAMGLAELAAFLGLGFMRDDMATAMGAPSFWWRLASMGLVAALGAGVALFSTDPARSPRRGLRWIAVCVAPIFAAGWLIDAGRDGSADLLARLDWTHGVQCVWKMVVLSLPAMAALVLLLRRGAPTDRSGTALAAGLAAAAWGAFVFVFACPSDDPLYIAVWYTIDCAIVTLFGRAIVPLLTRW